MLGALQKMTSPNNKASGKPASPLPQNSCALASKLSGAGVHPMHYMRQRQAHTLTHIATHGNALQHTSTRRRTWPISTCPIPCSAYTPHTQHPAIQRPTSRQPHDTVDVNKCSLQIKSMHLSWLSLSFYLRKYWKTFKWCTQNYKNQSWVSVFWRMLILDKYTPNIPLQ